MDANVQNFTRYFYQNKFTSSTHRNTFSNPSKMIDGDFDEFILSNTVYPFGIDAKQENKLSVKLTIEPFKNRNTNSKGYVLYLQKNVPFCKDVTGLRSCKFNYTYHGDIYEIEKKGFKKKELILFQVIPETRELIIDVFYGYYPVNKTELLKIINQHPWHKKTTVRGGLKSFKTFKGIKNQPHAR
jgi:hypothetical protein